jgi:SAM-dependent methyltransferase
VSTTDRTGSDGPAPARRRAPDRAQAGRTQTDFREGLYAHYVSRFKGSTRTSEDVEGAFAWWDHKFLPLLEGVERNAPMLDLGCGNGRLLGYLERRGFSHAVGIDISAEQITIARERGAHAEVGDLFEFLGRPQHANNFAAILAVDILEHLSRDELMAVASLLHTALQPGGRLLIQTANGAGLLPGQVIYGDLTHLTIFTPQSLGQLLQAADFVDLSFYETGPVPIRLRGKLDFALWQAIKTCARAVRRIETGKDQSIWTENFICRGFKR